MPCAISPEAQAQRDIAAASVEEANIEAAQLQFDQTKLFAPIDGMISQPLVGRHTKASKAVPPSLDAPSASRSHSD